MFAKRMSLQWSLVLQKGTRSRWGQLLFWGLAPAKALCSDTCANPFFPPGYFCLHRNGMLTHGLSDIIAPFFLLSHYCKLEEIKHDGSKPTEPFPTGEHVPASKQYQRWMLSLFILTDRFSLCNTVWLRIHCVYEVDLKLSQLSCPGSHEYSDYRCEPPCPVSS